MEFSLPEFPTAPGAQAAFVAVGLLMLIGLLLMLFPGSAGRLLGLDSRETRPGGIGEVRVAGGFICGLSVATLLFDQPVLYTAVGVALMFSAFARLISLMSDRSTSLLNLLLLLVQAVLAGASLYYFFDVVTPEIQFAVPEEQNARLAYFAYIALAAIGVIVLFAPRIAMAVPGLAHDVSRPTGLASIRSAGGFLLGASLFAIGLFNPMLDLGLAGALAFSILGRLLALGLNRGNLLFNAIALVFQAIAAALVIFYITGMM